METTLPATSSSSLHPVLWIAGISVTLLSLAGVAALTGFLPAKTAPVPERPAIVAAAPVTEPVPAVAPAVPVARAAFANSLLEGLFIRNLCLSVDCRLLVTAYRPATSAVNRSRSRRSSP